MSATSDSVKVTLRLLSRTTKINSFPSFKLSLSNVGKEALVISDPIFTDTGALKQNINSRTGLFLEVRGPNGQLLQPAPPRQFSEPSDDEDLKSSGLLAVKNATEERMVEGWRQQGLSQHEIDAKLMAYNSRQAGDAAANRASGGFKLEPGKKAEIKASLDQYDFDRPGSYRMRAVYDRRVDDASRKKYGFKVLPGQVLVQTKWISFEVLVPRSVSEANDQALKVVHGRLSDDVPKSEDRIPAVDRKKSEQLYLSGVIFFQKGEYQKAKSEWIEAASLNPSNDDAKAGLERIRKMYSGERVGEIQITE